MSIDKDSEEWLVMRYFREKYTDFPRGKLVKSESPDFILKLSRKRSIGIELTRLDYMIKDNPDHLPEQLIKLLEKKEAKLNLYRKKLFAEYWLIFTAENISSSFFLPELMVAESQFDRVYIFDLFSGQIIEI
jgi:hypothetical protein